MRRFITLFTPPIMLNVIRRFRRPRYGWLGDYDSWQEAQHHSTGYDSELILTKVKNALLKVKNGEALYERDSVLFDEIHYSWQLLSGLMLCSAKSRGRLHVVDFGGSLGSSYYQNKKFLDNLEDLSWSIVEQKHFVDVGKRVFEDERLHFFYDIESCIKSQNPNLLLLSSVLQYIEKPYELLDQLLYNRFDFVVVDLTLITCGRERLSLQVVNPSIYEASYPCWLLDIEKINALFYKHGYTLIEDFNALDNFEVFSEREKIGKYIGQIRMHSDR